MAHNTITTPDSSSSYTELRSAGNAIAENSDLITQILVRLPVKPLTQFKSVSKQWLYLISDSQFSLHHSRRNRKPISALFLLSLKKINPEFSFLPFADCSLGSPHFQFLAHPGTSILHSCNGLLCFSKLDDTTESSILRYYVCNPTTKRSARIPLLGLVHNCRIRRGYFRVDHKLCNVKIEESTRPGNDLNINLLGIYVAFDPLKSQNYRIVCVWESNADMFNYEIRIAVYRSEIGLWGELMGAFTIPYAVCLNNGVFWNGKVHWISSSDIHSMWLGMNVYNLSTTKFIAYHFDEREMAYHCNADRISIVYVKIPAVTRLFLSHGLEAWSSCVLQQFSFFLVI
ncbi:F-box protein [Camellia lanceoleosa]|uniref:F-box protein n=1 Tax=Camellia lanceoleosa TaxID=1840588 RepID=A0ACC0HYY8_9ERIC|nr:F-box protein [Camellia lanceoleosa]